MNDVPPLPAHPRLRPGIEAVAVENDRMLLRSFSGTVMLSGEFVASRLREVLARLDGRSTVGELMDAVPEQDRPELAELLGLLLRRGLLADGMPSGTGHDDAYWSLFEATPGDAAARLRAATVLIAGLGGVGRAVARLLATGGIGRLLLLDPRPVAQAVASELAATGAETVPIIAGLDGLDCLDRILGDASLVILAGDTMSLAGYDRINQACLQHGTPWTSARIDRTRGIVGPFVVPRQTACFTCYELRSRANAEFPRDHEALHRHWKQAAAPSAPWPGLAAFAEMLGACVALDAQRMLGLGSLSAFLGRVLHWDAHGCEQRFHPLLKLPRCPACSRTRERPLERIWDIRPSVRR